MSLVNQDTSMNGLTGLKIADFPIKLNKEYFLHPVAKGDAKEIFQRIDDSRDTLGPWLPWVGSTKKLIDTENFLDIAEKSHQNLSALHLGVFQSSEVVEHNKYLGMVGFREINAADESAVIGYWLTNDAQGKGICTDACRGLLQYGEKIGIKTFEIHCDTRNKKSCAVAKRLGFKENKNLTHADFPDEETHVAFSYTRQK